MDLGDQHWTKRTPRNSLRDADVVMSVSAAASSTSRKNATETNNGNRNNDGNGEKETVFPLTPLSAGDRSNPNAGEERGLGLGRGGRSPKVRLFLSEIVIS